MNTTRATTSPDITDDSLAWLEDNPSFRDAAVHQRWQHLLPLLSLWGEPCFETVDFPAASIAGFDQCCRARVSLDPGPQLGTAPLFVRRDHRELWEGVQELKRREWSSERGFVLWGQPGQGKTAALDVYSLICCENRIPFVRYINGEEKAVLFISTDQGARLYEVTPDDLDGIIFVKENYYFVDAGMTDEPFNRPYGRLTVTLFATSPVRKRYKFAVKDGPYRLGTIALCSREEALLLPLLHALPPTPPIHTSSFTRFESLNLSIPSGVPDEGYNDETVAADLASPGIDTPEGLCYPPIVRYHLCGPDMRRLQDRILIQPGQSLVAANLLSIDFSRFLREAAGISHPVDFHTWFAEYHQVLFRTPLPVASPHKRWALESPDYKLIIPNQFLRDGLVHASASLPLDEQRRALNASHSTPALKEFVFEGYVYSRLSQLREVNLVVLTFSSNGEKTTEVITLGLQHNEVVNEVKEWNLKEVSPAPSAPGVYPVVPRTFSTGTGLLIAVCRSSAQETHSIEAEKRIIFHTPVPSPSSSPVPPAARPLINVVYQPTAARALDMTEKGRRRREEIFRGLDAREEASEKRRRIFAFVCPGDYQTKRLAEDWSKKGVEGFEVGYLLLS